jgi:hypothetical protein
MRGIKNSNFVHCYLDEGGLFGNIKFTTSKVKFKEKKEEHHIHNYYVGLLSRELFTHYIYLLSKEYPNVKVIEEKTV